MHVLRNEESVELPEAYIHYEIMDRSYLLTVFKKNFISCSRVKGKSSYFFWRVV